MVTDLSVSPEMWNQLKKERHLLLAAYLVHVTLHLLDKSEFPVGRNADLSIKKVVVTSRRKNTPNTPAVKFFLLIQPLYPVALHRCENNKDTHRSVYFVLLTSLCTSGSWKSGSWSSWSLVSRNSSCNWCYLVTLHGLSSKINNKHKSRDLVSQTPDIAWHGI